MESPKVKIRERVKEILKGRTIAGDRVYSGRSIVTWGSKTPAINLFMNSEVLDRYSDRPKRYRRQMNLSVELMVLGTNSLEDTGPNSTHTELDEFVEAVETLIEVDETLGLKDPCVSMLNLLNVDYEFESGGDAPTASAILTFEIIFYQYAKRPGVQCLDDLKQVAVDYKIGHDREPSDDTVDAQDLFEFENE